MSAGSGEDESAQTWAPNFVALPWSEEVVSDGDTTAPIGDPTVLGYATFQHSHYDSKMWCDVSLGNARQVTGVSIHEGPHGENGDQLVDLSLEDGPGDFHGEYLKDTLERHDDRLRNSAEGDVNVVADAMEANEAYLQVELQDGAIRGQTRYDMFDMRSL